MNAKEAVARRIQELCVQRGLAINAFSSIDVLCRKVGISKTFFYSFFSSKEELVLL